MTWPSFCLFLLLHPLLLLLVINRDASCRLLLLLLCSSYPEITVIRLLSHYSRGYLFSHSFCFDRKTDSLASCLPCVRVTNAPALLHPSFHSFLSSHASLALLHDLLVA